MTENINKLNKLKRMLLSPQCSSVSVFGQDKNTRDFLVSNLKAYCGEVEDKLVLVEVDMEALGGQKESEYFSMWKSILTQMLKALVVRSLEQDELAEDLAELEAEDLETAADLFEEALDLVKEAGLKTVLLLKNFDAAKRVFGQQPGHFQYLRAVKGAQKGLIIVFASEKSLSEIETTAVGTSLLCTAVLNISVDVD